jgi:hypothetical protein
MLMLISSSRRRLRHLSLFPLIDHSKKLIPELDAFDKEKTKKLAKEYAQAALKKSGQF